MPLDYASWEYTLAATQAVLAMLGMGATLTVRDFLGVLRAPRGVVLVLVLQLLLMPPLAIGLSHVMGLPQGIAVGLLLIAAMPGGTFSNIFTYLGRGNVALSISATSVSTLGCLVTTAALLRLYGSAQFPDDFVMPMGRIVLEIVCWLLTPLIIGMCIRRYAVAIQATVAKVAVRCSLGVLGVIVVGALGSGRIQVAAYGWKAPMGLILFGVGSILLCYLLGFLLRFSRDDSFTIGVEVTVRNGNLALLLKASLFPALADERDLLSGGVLYSILFYGGASLVIAGVAVFRRRWKHRRAQALATSLSADVS